MSLFEDVVQDFAPNALVGVAAVLLVPVVYPVVRGALRPVAKGAIKGYLTLEDKLKEFAADTGEQFSDLVAEAKVEHAGTAAGSAAAGTAAARARTPRRKTAKSQRSGGASE